MIFRRKVKVNQCTGIEAGAGGWGPLPLNYLIRYDLPLEKTPSPSRGGLGWGWGQLRRKNTPIPLLTSPLKGEEPGQRKIIAG